MLISLKYFLIFEKRFTNTGVVHQRINLVFTSHCLQRNLNRSSPVASLLFIVSSTGSRVQQFPYRGFQRERSFNDINSDTRYVCNRLSHGHNVSPPYFCPG